MKSKEDVESYLLRAELRYEEVADGLWVLRVGGVEIALKLASPVLVVRVNVMDVPKQKREECFRTLLELNAREMVHSAFGLENGKIVIVGAMEMENLDFNEFQALIDDVTYAVSVHHSRLSQFREAA